MISRAGGDQWLRDVRPIHEFHHPIAHRQSKSNWMNHHGADRQTTMDFSGQRAQPFV
jgi:hypothetical protein